MLTSNKKDGFEHIKRATIKTSGKQGQGVYVGSNLFLTAAHCVNFETSGSMALGDYFIEEIEIQGETFRVAPLAVEPISDVAVLGPLDEQEFPDDVDRLEEFCENLDPVLISDFEPEIFKEMNVYVFSHEDKIISGKGQVCTPGSSKMFIEAEEEIKGGTSGGPIVDESGRLVGIVSNSSTGTESSEVHPRPNLALPVWVWRKLERGPE
ncbi:MAG: serine protease [Desulfovermiculus sp.]|nr:serine protease [Desulfovermiculus sp.]